MDGTKPHQIYLVATFKALADPIRLQMVRMLAHEEITTKTLSERLGVTEPTISHHLSKLRAAGLVQLRMQGNQSFYKLATGPLQRFKEQVARLEEAIPEAEDAADNDWIEALPFSAEDKKILHDYTFGGRLRQIPVKGRKLLVVLNWLAMQFEAGRTYTEQEVNTIISRYHDDYATLRRELINFGYLRRERAGTTYWVTPEDEAVPHVRYDA